MKKKALYTTPEEVRALLRSCWPEETFALDNDVIASGGQADVYRLHSKTGLRLLKSSILVFIRIRTSVLTESVGPNRRFLYHKTQRKTFFGAGVWHGNHAERT